MNFLKNILKNVITNIIGFFVSIFLIFIIFTIMVAIFSTPDDKANIIEVKENSILFIDDINIIGDRDLKGDDLDINLGFSLPGLNEDLNKEKISLRTFKTLIDSAKNDENIKSIVLNLDNALIPFNKLKQVRDILSSFREVKAIYSAPPATIPSTVPAVGFFSFNNILFSKKVPHQQMMVLCRGLRSVKKLAILILKPDWVGLVCKKRC